MRGQPPGQVVGFRLYPESPRGLYVSVRVHPSHRAMRAYARTHGDHKSAARDCHGFCQCFTRQRLTGDRWRTLPEVAMVHLYRQRLTMRVVTHELLHATLAWARRIRFPWGALEVDPVNAEEERLVYAHGHLCAEFMRRAEAAGLYDG